MDNLLRPLSSHPVTTITSGERSLLYSPEYTKSQLYDLNSDPKQLKDVMGTSSDDARELHKLLVKFMHETDVPDRLRKPRLELHV